jgi:thiol-disulfide isomerase/thioredoxin
MNKSKTTLALAAIAALVALAAFTNGTGDGYPPIVKEKTLYAKNDLRGLKAPKLEVAEWLTGAAPATKGKVVLIDFWATWCGPCREGIPKLNKWAEKYKDDVVVIGISDEKAETVNGFRKGTPMNYSLALDATKKMNGFVGVQGIPHVLVISADGVVRWQGWPDDPKDKLDEAKMDQIIAQSKKDFALGKNGG